MSQVSLITARENAGLNRQQAADRLGIVKDTLHAYEIGLFTPRLEILRGMEKLYGVEVRNLIIPKYNSKMEKEGEEDK